MKKHLALFLSICFFNFLFAQDISKILDIKEKNDTLSFLKKGLKEIQILDGRKKKEVFVRKIKYNRNGLILDDISYDDKKIYNRIEYIYHSYRDFVKKHYDGKKVVFEQVFENGNLQKSIHSKKSGKVLKEVFYEYQDSILSKVFISKKERMKKLFAELNYKKEKDNTSAYFCFNHQDTLKYLVFKNEAKELKKLEIYENSELTELKEYEKINDTVRLVNHEFGYGKKTTYTYNENGKILNRKTVNIYTDKIFNEDQYSYHYKDEMTGVLIYQDEKLIARKTNQFYENSKLKTSEIFLLVENHLSSQFRKVFEGNYNYYDNGNVKDYFGTNFKIETVALYTVSNKTKFHYNFRYIKY